MSKKNIVLGGLGGASLAYAALSAVSMLTWIASGRAWAGVAQQPEQMPEQPRTLGTGAWLRSGEDRAETADTTQAETRALQLEWASTTGSPTITQDPSWQERPN
jgi:hypothetical protein